MLGKFALAAAVALLASATAVAAPAGPWGTGQKVTEVNTAEYQDGCPILSPDGRQLFLASNRPEYAGDATLDLNIWVATRESADESFGAPEILPAPVNSAANDFCPTPLRGGKLLFVSNRSTAESCGQGDIYMSRLHPKKGWLEPQHLRCSPDGPNSSLDEQGPSLIEVDGGHELFFSRSSAANPVVPGDLFVSARPDGGEFGPAAAIAELSSPGNDIQPNVRKDGLEIVFSSSYGYPGAQGKQDIYSSSRESVDAPWSAAGQPRHGRQQRTLRDPPVALLESRHAALRPRPRRTQHRRHLHQHPLTDRHRDMPGVITTLFLAAGGALALAACGDAGSQGTGLPRDGRGTLASAPQSQIPEALAGTWQTTIESARVVDAPSGLTQERSVWKLKFLGTGGEGNGPSIFLSNEQVGEIVHSISLQGDEITLHSGTDCKRFVYADLGMEKLQIRSTEQDQGCPSTLVSSVLQRPWLLVEGGPSRLEPTAAEASLASKEAFVGCARRRDELGIVVGFRDGRAFPLPGPDAGGARFNTRVSAPQAVAAVLEDGGQYVGLREGAGPDVDLIFHNRPQPPRPTHEDVYSPLSRLLDEAAEQGIVSSNHGDYSELAGSQEFVTVRPDGRPPGWDEDLGVLRVPRALSHLVPCFREAVRAADGS